MPDTERVQTEHRFEVKSVIGDRIFGWAYVSVKADGTEVTDHSGEYILPDDLEKAAYEFVLDYREGDEFHTAEVKAQMIESIVFTLDKQKALGIPDGVVPQGWWVGFKLMDEELVQKANDGVYPMLSIGGFWLRETAA